MKYFLLLILSFPVHAQEFFNVDLRAQWTDTNIVVGPGNVRYNDLWGFKVDGQKYAVVGSNEGSHFLRVNEYEVEEVWKEKGAFSSILVQHRDYKRYKNYIYAVCDEGSSTLQIFDITYLPDSVHKVYDSNEHFTIAHNLFIDTLTAKLYVCGPDNVGMKIFDISSPHNPILLLNFSQLAYVHDCYVSNDTAFLNAAEDGLRIYNFSNTDQPSEIGVLSFYPEQGYNHSGWMDRGKQVYCFVDETLGKKIKYCQLQNGIVNIKVDALFGTQDAAEYIPHNIMIENGYAFVSYYNEGLRIFDLESKPIKQAAFYDTYNIESSFKLHGAWGVYVFQEEELVLISDRQSGLFSFYFPFSSFRSLKGSHQLNGTPFINSESKLLIDPFNKEELLFDIYTIAGQLCYQSELVRNWINIPLDLPAGEFVYRLSNVDKKIEYTGKFVIIRD